MGLPIRLALVVAAASGAPFFEKVRGLQRSGTTMMQSIFDTCAQRACVSECTRSGCPKRSAKPGPCCAPGTTRFGEPFPVPTHNTHILFDPVQHDVCHKHFLFRARTPYARVVKKESSARFVDASVARLADLDRLSSFDGNGTDAPIYVVVVKHPIAWALSACKFWKCDRKLDRHGEIYEFVRLWNAYVGTWVALRDEDPGRVLLLRYEALLADPVDALEPVMAATDAASRGCLARLATRLADTGSLETDAGARVDVYMSSGQSWAANKRYYENCEYLDRPQGLDLGAGGDHAFAIDFPQYVAAANATVDRDVLQRAGYARDPWSTCHTDAAAVVARYNATVAAKRAHQRSKGRPVRGAPEVGASLFV